MKPFNVQDIRQYFIDALNNEQFVVDKSGVKTLELINANFIIIMTSNMTCKLVCNYPRIIQKI